MKKKHLPLILSAVVCALALCIMISILICPAQTEQVPFTPPPFEQGAVSGVPVVPENLGWGQLDAKVYKVSVCGVLQVENGKIDVWLTNPEENNVWMKLRILDLDGNLLGETGIIRPGEYVRQVTLNEIPGNGENVALKIMAYEPESYYSAGAVTLNTTISG